MVFVLCCSVGHQSHLSEMSLWLQVPFQEGGGLGLWESLLQKSTGHTEKYMTSQSFKKATTFGVMPNLQKNNIKSRFYRSTMGSRLGGRFVYRSHRAQLAMREKGKIKASLCP